MVFSNVDATPLRYLSSESRHVADDLKLNEPIPKKRKLDSKASMPKVAIGTITCMMTTNITSLQAML